ncbi:MAG: hypothetical protein HKM23_00700 [Nitrosopumilus sp.]|nr:hypothetical protein [Nitrosopumilus sp.]
MRILLVTTIARLLLMVVVPSTVDLSFGQMKEPEIMNAKKGDDLSKWGDLIDQRRNQTYDGERHQFETGILLL